MRAPVLLSRRLDAPHRNQSNFFIAASSASGSKSNERSKLESGSAAPLFPSPCRFRDDLESCGEVEVAAAAAAGEGKRGTGALLAPGADRARGGRNGFFAAAEWGVLDGARSTLRVMPSARLDPCACDAGSGRSAGVTEVEVEVADVEVKLKVEVEVEVEEVRRCESD